PIAKVIQSMYPFYTKYNRLGGALRKHPLDPATLNVRDLEAATADARNHATTIYDGVYHEYTNLLDHNRNLQPTWLEDARANLQAQQARLIDDLEEKLKQAPETASDEFMYQDKAETERELHVAKKLLAEVPSSLCLEG